MPLLDPREDLGRPGFHGWNRAEHAEQWQGCIWNAMAALGMGRRDFALVEMQRAEYHAHRGDRPVPFRTTRATVDSAPAAHWYAYLEVLLEEGRKAIAVAYEYNKTFDEVSAFVADILASVEEHRS